MSVPLFDTSTVLEPLREELRTAVARVLDSERYILGPEVQAFEQEFATYCGVGHAVGVANGTDAITIALRAMGVGPGDEVMVPSFTFFASVEAIAPTGATPVFCDVDPQTFCINAETVADALTPHTKTVIAVHLFGNVAPVAEIEALGVPVLEDAAQAAGSTGTHSHPGTHSHSAAHGHSAAHSHSSAQVRPGALGRAATFSFFPSKNLGCFGDGGMIVTDDAHLADEARVLRFHGSRDKVSYELLGYNSRLDELQAAILRVQLPHLDDWSDGRRRAAEYYVQAGLGELVTLPRPTLGSSPAWHLYVVRHHEADRLATALTDAGIGCRAYYRTPVHEQPAMRAWGAGLKLPGTDEAARTHLAIPISPVLSDEQVEQVVAAVRAARPASVKLEREAHSPTGQCSRSSPSIEKCLGLPVASRAPIPTAAAAIRQSAWLSVTPSRACSLRQHPARTPSSRPSGAMRIPSRKRNTSGSSRSRVPRSTSSTLMAQIHGNCPTSRKPRIRCAAGLPRKASISTVVSSSSRTLSRHAWDRPSVQRSPRQRCRYPTHVLNRRERPSQLRCPPSVARPQALCERWLR